MWEETQCEATDIEYFHAVTGNEVDENGKEIINPNGNEYGFRFICKLKNIKEFVSRKNGSEIDERKFVTLDELPKYITWFDTAENGKESLQKLQEKIS